MMSLQTLPTINSTCWSTKPVLSFDRCSFHTGQMELSMKLTSAPHTTSTNKDSPGHCNLRQCMKPSHQPNQALCNALLHTHYSTLKSPGLAEPALRHFFLAKKSHCYHLTADPEKLCSQLTERVGDHEQERGIISLGFGTMLH